MADTEKKTLARRAVATIQSLLQSRATLAGRLAGKQFGGERDVYQVAGYVKPGSETFEHYWGLYTRGDIAGRIVDMPAKTTWRTPPRVVEKDQKDGTEFTKAFETLAKRLRLWSYFSRVDRLSGVGRYAVMLIGVRGVTDSQLDIPLTKLTKPEDILYLALYSEANAQVQEWVTDPSDPRFGLPRIYRLTTSEDSQTAAAGFKQAASLTVHASRVLHIAEDVLEDDVFGRPRLQRALNRLFDLDKVAACTGEAYWQSVTRILQGVIDPEMEVDQKQLADLDEKLQEMVHDLRRSFYGQGMQLSWLPSDTPDPGSAGDFLFTLIAAAAEIPKRILFGSEQGELASSQDQENYHGRINERQEQFAEPVILRQFIDRLLTWGALPKPKTGDYEVTWPTLFEVPEKDKAQAGLYRAQTAQALTPVGGNPLELVRIDEEQNVILVEREPAPPMEFNPLQPDQLLNPDGTPVDPNAPHPAGAQPPHPTPPANPQGAGTQQPASRTNDATSGGQKP